MRLANLIETYQYLVKGGNPPSSTSSRKHGDQSIVTVSPWKMLDKVYNRYDST